MVSTITMKRFTAIFCLLILGFTSHAQNYQPGTTVYVTASGLALRYGPSTDDERIHYLPKGEAVTVLEDSLPPQPFEAEGIKGHWIKVKHGHHEGYVFDGFVSPERPAPEERLDWLCIPGERVGPIRFDTSLQDLIAFFGGENVQDAVIDQGQGSTIPGTAIFPDKQDEALIRWRRFHQEPASVILRRPGGHWKTENGVSVGMSLAKLEQLNGGRPIGFMGLGWDFAGRILHWNGGVLEKSLPVGSKVRIRLGTDRTYAGPVMDETTFGSNDPDVKKAGLEVVEIEIMLHSPDVPADDAPPAPSHPNALATMPPPKPGATRHVLAARLNMRDAPALNSERLAQLPYGETVIVDHDDAPRVPLVAEGMHGHWLKVRSLEMTGYVFDAYLIPFPPPAAGVSGVWQFADTSLGSTGEPEKRTEGTTQQGMEITVERYNHGAVIEDTSRWSPTFNQHTTTLTLQDISAEQAFLIAIKVHQEFANAEFDMNENGILRLQSKNGTLTIRSLPDGRVQIIEANRLE